MAMRRRWWRFWGRGRPVRGPVSINDVGTSLRDRPSADRVSDLRQLDGDAKKVVEILGEG